MKPKSPGPDGPKALGGIPAADIKDTEDSRKQFLIMTRKVLICHECQSRKMSCCQMINVVPILKLTIYFGFLYWHKD